MQDYIGIGIYAGFAFSLFVGALLWHRFREDIKKRFHLLNYHAKNDAASKHA